ncbi:MAG: pentapeptide repeat-containing protein, partial [Pirellulaceae bacterium]
MIDAINSPVAPRVTSPCTGEVVQLADEIELLLARGELVSVQIDGENSRAALEHLTAVLPDAIADGRLRLEDDMLPLDAGDPIVVVRTAHESQCDIVLRLANWSRDDFIEYLLAKHPTQCASVMSRLKNANHLLAGGSPLLWQVILDRMAVDESKADVEEIVVNELHARLSTESLARAIADRLIFPASQNDVGVFGHRGEGDSDDTNIMLSRSHSSIRQFLKHEDVRRLFAMERFVDRVRAANIGEMRMLLSGPTRLGHWRAVSKRIAGDLEVQTKLQELFDQNRQFTTANCATLLSMCQSDWRPRGKQMKLCGGRFQNVNWPDIDLRDADLRKASFAAANLKGARLGDAEISGADFSDANLSLADFSCASEPVDLDTLTNSQGNSAPKGKRGSKRKKLETRSHSQGKIIEYANLRFHSRTSFVDAKLTGANLSGCRFRGADFRGADLTNVLARHAEFEDLNLDGATLVNADFSGVTFQNVKLEAVNIDGCDFRGLRSIGKL